MDDPQADPSTLAFWLPPAARPLGAVILCATLVALIGVSRLDFSDNPRDIFSRADAQTRLLDEVHSRFGADDTDVVVVLDSPDLLTEESLGLIRTFVEALRADERLAAVHSLLDARRVVRLGRRNVPWMIVPPEDRENPDYGEVRELLLSHPLLRDRMLSSDGQTTIIVAQMPDTVVEIAEVADTVAVVRRHAESVFSNTRIRARLTGQPPLRVDTFHNLKSDQIKFSFCCGVTLFVIALALFRQLQPVLISLAGPAVGVLWTVGAMGWLGQRFDGINVVLPMLLFVIGFTDSLHLVVAIRKSRRKGASPFEAAVGALESLGHACFLTSLTTAIGFGSLTLSSLSSVHRFGIYAAAGAILLYLAVITVIPLLSMAPWFNQIVSESSHRAALAPAALTTAVRPILRWSRAVSLVGIVVLVSLAWSCSDVPFDMHWSEALPASGETVEAIHHLDQTMGGSVLALVLVEWPEGFECQSPEVLEFLADLHEKLAAYSEPTPTRPTRLGQPTSILTVLDGLRPPNEAIDTAFPQLRRRAPERLNKLYNNEARQALVTMPVPEAGARTLLPIFDSIEADLDQLMESHPGFSVQLTGSTVVSARNLHAILLELVQSVLLAAGLVFLVLCVAFRSLRLGLLSVPPNSIPLVAVIAALGPIGAPMQVTAALTLCLGLGIAVDDTIHLIARFRREQSRGGSDKAACLRAYRAVGHVIVLTTVILICGFSTMTLSESPAIRLFGLLSCVALAAALVGDLVLLPALLARWSPSQSKA